MNSTPISESIRRPAAARVLAGLVMLAGLLAGLLLPGAARATDIEDFFGQYEGEAVSSDGAGDVSRRDISVHIKAYQKAGFSLEWTTVTRRSDGRLKRKSHSVNFVPSGTDNVYASAMRTNLFGKAVPMDPLKGDPYVWATLAGRTLTVYALVITDDHGYEMQTYRRTRTERGLDLVFHRVRDGERLKDITGTLVRIED